MKLKHIGDPVYKTKYGQVNAAKHRLFRDALDQLLAGFDVRPADTKRLQPRLAKVAQTGQDYITGQLELNPVAEGALTNAGHVALDVAGLVPGVGEPADLANALWYAENGEYLNAAFSLLSMIPELGDAIGKGAKYLGKGSKHVSKFIAKYGDDIIKHWDKVLKIVAKMEKWRPFIQAVNNAMNEFLSTKDKVTHS